MIFNGFFVRISALFFSAVLLAAAGCSDTPDTDTAGGNDKDSLNLPPKNLQLKGQNFMVPSPVQIAGMIKSSGALYNKEMLNPAANLSRYSDDMKRALNLGVYGADLGYVSMYENTTDALSYYKTVMTLGEQMRINASFDKQLLERFSANIGKKDSVMKIVGESYRRSDEFLKEGDREHVAALILAGGWIESMHFALSVYKIKPEPDMAVRIGEQKNTCAGILKLLVEQDKPEFEQLIKLYQDLNNVYSQIEMKYTFAEPVTDNANKITTINGKTEVNITTEQLTALTEKTAALRNYIIN
ncbi:MAG: hypothetical protein ACK5Z2_06350 [Bacteroidota bacterium]|jgi:hypothetical protein